MHPNNEFVEKYINFTRSRIGSLRQQKGDSANKMSQLVGLNDAYISRIETKERVPSLQALFAICEFLSVTPHEFFDEENPNPALIKKIVDNLKLIDDDGLASILNITNEMARK